jgi:superfamily II DNA/RNA helicase
MASAKISLPGGISVHLDGTSTEVAAVLQDLKTKYAADLRTVQTTRRPIKARGEIPGLVEALKAEEFFKSPKGLSEVQKKLADLGHHYPVTTLSGAMQAQSRNRNLRRFKQNGKYVYVQ